MFTFHRTFSPGERRGWPAPMPSILVVDDDAVHREVSRQIFARFGCEVAAASSGEEAVLAMRAFGENFQKVADTTVAKRECQRRLVVMDVHLGQGMDGYVAAEMIKADAAAQGIPPPHIVIVSGDEPSEVQERCSRCGLDFLPKPVGREQFRNVLSAHGIAV